MKYFVSILVLLVFFSCRKKNETPDPVDVGAKGIFVVNEGNFTWANSSLSFFDKSGETFHPDIFAEANGIPLGDVAYSMTVYKNKGYIVVNNSGLIYIVNLSDMKYSGKITGLVSPRQMLVVNDSLAYVSDLYNTRIVKINPFTQSVTGYINIGCSSESMLLVNGKIIVSSWSYNNKVFAFDALTGNITDSVTVGKQPNSMVSDVNGNIWVLCDGCFAGSTYGEENPSLWCLTPVDLSEIKHFVFPGIQDSPVRLCMNATKDTLFYINKSICRQSINEASLQTTPFISSNGRNFYGLNVQANNEIVVTDAKNYINSGDMLIYSSSGQLKKTYTTGVNPGWITVIDQ